VCDPQVLSIAEIPPYPFRSSKDAAKCSSGLFMVKPQTMCRASWKGYILMGVSTPCCLSYISDSEQLRQGGSATQLPMDQYTAIQRSWTNWRPRMSWLARSSRWTPPARLAGILTTHVEGAHHSNRFARSGRWPYAPLRMQG
jgi:hypothetical protein